MSLTTNQVINKEDLLNYSVAPYELAQHYVVGNTIKDTTTGVIYTCISPAPAGTPLTNSTYFLSADPTYGLPAAYSKSYKKGDVVKDPVTGIEYILTKDLPAGTTTSNATMSIHLQNLANAVQTQPVAMDHTKSYPAGTEVIDPVTGKKYTLASNYAANTAASDAALSTYLQNPANTYPAQPTTNNNGSTSKAITKSGATTLSKTELAVAIGGNNSSITFAPVADYEDGAILFIDVGNYTGITIHPNAGASIFPDAVNTARNLAPNSTFMYRKQGTTWKWIA